MSLSKFKVNSKAKITFWVTGVLSCIVRLYVNFSQELLIGNGGYYPLQVRAVLERNELAFPDMPLLFYLDAGILHLFSFFGVTITNDLILDVVKVMDSISIPLLLIPLYSIFKRIKAAQFSTLIVLTAGYAVLSLPTLSLISTSQKNSLAIVFLVSAIAFIFKFFDFRKRINLFLSVVFLVLIGITHFGTFSFALLVLFVCLVIRYRWKAVLPLIGILLAGVMLIYLFDPTRSMRLLSVWEEFFSAMPNIPQLISMLLYLVSGIFALKAFRKFKSNFNREDQIVIKTLIALLFIVPLPIVNPQYTSRMSMFLFLPHVLLLFYFSGFLLSRVRNFFSIVLGFVITISLIMSLGGGPPKELSSEGLNDLGNMKSLIINPKETVVVSKHNLEFWVAWELEVNVSQEAKFDKELIDEYQFVFIINQLDTKKMHPKEPDRGPSHFDEPKIPTSSQLVYTSKYFKLYKYLKE